MADEFNDELALAHPDNDGHDRLLDKEHAPAADNKGLRDSDPSRGATEHHIEADDGDRMEPVATSSETHAGELSGDAKGRKCVEDDDPHHEASLEGKTKPEVSEVTGVAAEAASTGMLALFLKQHLETMLFKLPIHISLFPLLGALKLIETVALWREAKLAHAKEVEGWKGKLLVAGISTVGFLALAAALVVSFLLVSPLSPILFIASLAVGAAAQIGFGVYHLKKAFEHEKGSKERKEYLKKAGMNFLGFVIIGALAAAVAMLMLVLAPVASKLWAGIGIGASVAGLGYRMPWGKIHTKVKGWFNRTAVTLAPEGSKTGNGSGPDTTPAPAATSVAAPAESGHSNPASEATRARSQSQPDRAANDTNDIASRPRSKSESDAVAAKALVGRGSSATFARLAAGGAPSADTQECALLGPMPRG